MNQLRLDPLSGRWVVVSTGRADRPSAFVLRSPSLGDTNRPCPFCPGNEEESPPALETYGPTGSWSVRVVPNRYPAFSGDEPFVVTNRGPVFTQASAGGIHEVLIFSPEHRASWATISEDQTGLVMAALRDRIEEHSLVPHLRYTQAIVNSGREAGASLEHPHGQLLGMSFVPRELAEEQARFARFAGRCLLCTTVEAEESEGYRVIYSDDRVVVVCPFWSAMPYEMLVIPRTHNAQLYRSPTEDLVSVGRSIKSCLTQLKDLIGDVAYNLVFHSAPYRVNEPFHWHVHVWPKAATQAGFEMGTGVAINIVNPELAAEQLRVGVLVS
jgi:UDPglucose--hexose-1-phosphate uridylyltransferase